ncbi:N-acetylmuramoyl-L-alanine amidase [Granulicatella adiacens]|uniref:N-acetylmuramoyl-L-alanine amidase n=1 Tax=Granulicatella adiacens TaxID=46124 RepID=UPI00241C0C85|nr:N-acetylmuramoyl-L-alanine amidase [Granulicatella adiacens]
MIQIIKDYVMEDSGDLVDFQFVVIHNDAGRMRPQKYIDFLRWRDKTLGIAHYYCNRKEIVQVVPKTNIGYHTGDWWSNCRSIGYEVCESLSANDQDFIQNEDVALMKATVDLLEAGLPINKETVRLHHEFVPTSCPHRSMELHGGTTESVKEYFIERMQYFASLGDALPYILYELGERKTLCVREYKRIWNTKKSPTMFDKTLIEEIIRGDWGNGDERANRLLNAGYNPVKVQTAVNRFLVGEDWENSISEDENNEWKQEESEKNSDYTETGWSNNVQNIDSIAAEVIQGDWGNGEERRERLEQAGYDYDAVQARVNEMLE